jgi:hypothetical protein
LLSRVTARDAEPGATCSGADRSLQNRKCRAESAEQESNG